MIRIGIIGTESSHAMAFARYFNLPDDQGQYRYDQIRVSALVGDAQSNEAICREVPIDFATEDPRELSGRVDAVMITTRYGSRHYEQAMPLIDKGIPLFIDKPFTADLTQAEELVQALQERKILAMGGSSCRYAPQVAQLRERVAQLRKMGEPFTATMCYTILESPYDGFWFYAPHLVEMALEVYGYAPTAVSAVITGACTTAILQYPDTAVTLHFVPEQPGSCCSLYTKSGTQFVQIDHSGGYSAEATCFAQLLLEGKMPQPLWKLSRHVRVIDGILRSIRADGARVSL